MSGPTTSDVLYNRLLGLYERRLHLPKNAVCRHCDAKHKMPLAPWHIGRSFCEEDTRVVFVGKPHRGTPAEPNDAGIIDPRAAVNSTFRKRRWPYWSYTREIAAEVFDGAKRGWDRIAMTNVIKCTNVGGDDASMDTTTPTMIDSCVRELKVLNHELQTLKPTHIVLYTGKLIPDVVEHLTLDSATSWTAVEDGHRDCGKKRLLWRSFRSPTARGENDVNALVVGHPERMKKAEYVAHVAGWIRGNVWELRLKNRLLGWFDEEEHDFPRSFTGRFRPTRDAGQFMAFLKKAPEPMLCLREVAEAFVREFGAAIVIQSPGGLEPRCLAMAFLTEDGRLLVSVTGDADNAASI